LGWSYSRFVSKFDQDNFDCKSYPILDIKNISGDIQVEAFSNTFKTSFSNTFKTSFSNTFNTSFSNTLKTSFSNTFKISFSNTLKNQNIFFFYSNLSWSSRNRFSVGTTSVFVGVATAIGKVRTCQRKCWSFTLLVHLSQS